MCLLFTLVILHFLPSHFIFTLMHSVLALITICTFHSPLNLSFSPLAPVPFISPVILFFHTFTIFLPLMYFISPLGTICTSYSSPKLLIFLLSFVFYSPRYPLFYPSLFSPHGSLCLPLVLSAPYVSLRDPLFSSVAFFLCLFFTCNNPSFYPSHVFPLMHFIFSLHSICTF